jgi:hypothetical protein
MSARVQVETDGTITIKVKNDPTAILDKCDVWTVFGIRDAGEPVTLAVVLGGEALAYRNDHFVGGVWEEQVSADGPREAAQRGAEQARARLAEAPWPARGAA